MNRKQLRSKIADLLASGMTKTRVFQTLSGPDIKDRRLAHAIASYADPRLCKANKRHVMALVVLAYLQLVVSVPAGFVIGLRISLLAGLICAVVLGGFAFLFVRGFQNNNVGAYHAYLLLTMAQFPRQLQDFSDSPAITVIGIVISLGLLAYVGYVRTRIFPDFAALAPRKVRGKYVFSD